MYILFLPRVGLYVGFLPLADARGKTLWHKGLQKRLKDVILELLIYYMLVYVKNVVASNVIGESTIIKG